MEMMTILGGAVVAALLLFGVFGVAIYNRLVRLRNRYENGYAQVDVQLQRRYDLIPNLVEATRGYLRHERETLEAVMRARHAAAAAEREAAQQPGRPEVMDLLERAEKTLSKGLGRLYAVMENYPDLKGDATIARLTEELTSTENRVAFARQAYNDFATVYNTTRETFPNVFFTQLFGFDAAHLLHIETPEARHAPRVSFA